MIDTIQDRCYDNVTMDNTAEQKSEWAQRELGALWKRESPNQKYLTGKVKVGDEDVNIVVFSNKHKTKDSQPDFRVYRSRDRQEVSTGSASENSSGEPQEELL